MVISEKTRKILMEYQRNELTGSLLYQDIAKHQKDEKNKQVFLNISKDEKKHYDIWKQYTGVDMQPKRGKLILFRFIRVLLGDTFTIKFFEKNEDLGIQQLNSIKEEFPEVQDIIDEEELHEDELMNMIDEERLHYVGSMVLGLNDALVELTGTIAGLTFALENTRLVALSGIITGISATLSMAASNYLAERADGNETALKSSAYTGIAYLVTVVLMVLPYLLLPNSMYVVAFAIMISVVILIILVFNYYISVAQGTPFFKRFGEMAMISLGVALISFVIGLLAKNILGINL